MSILIDKSHVGGAGQAAAPAEAPRLLAVVVTAALLHALLARDGRKVIVLWAAIAKSAER